MNEKYERNGIGVGVFWNLKLEYVIGGGVRQGYTF